MPKPAFIHPWTGETIDPTDERLIGTGNPPTAPGPVGHGRIPLTHAAVSDAKAAEAKANADAKRSTDKRRPHAFPQFDLE